MKQTPIDQETIKKIENLINIADSQRLSNDYKNCQKNTDALYEISLKHQYTIGLIRVYNLDALMNVSLSNYDKALELFMKASKLAHETDNNSLQSLTLNNMAQIYFTLGNYDEAVKMYEEAFKYDPNNYRALNNIANIYAERKQFDKAEENFKKALKRAESLNSIRSIAICYINLGIVERERNNYEKAKEYMENSIIYMKDLDDNDLKILHSIDFSEIFSMNNEFDKAEQILLDTIELSKKSKDKTIVLNCYKALAIVYSKKNDYKKAYEYSMKLSDLTESVFSKQLKDKIADIHNMYEFQTKEMKLREMMEKSSRLASIGVMAAGITHEINQPLNAISVSANSILYWNRKNPDVLPDIFIEEIEQIDKGSKRIDEIIKHMRNFWITKDSQLPEQIDINKAIEDALSLVENQLKSHGIELIKELCPNQTFIEANRINIEQVIINLVINAMHALDEMKTKDKKICIKTELCEKNLILKIIDNGVGLPDSGDIFDPFFSTKAPGKGMGLGLAIVKNIIEKLDGFIKAYNADEGTVLELSIPI